jgi:hypothetical protein
LTTSPPYVSRLSGQCGILTISQHYKTPRPATGLTSLFNCARINLCLSLSCVSKHIIATFLICSASHLPAGSLSAFLTRSYQSLRVHPGVRGTGCRVEASAAVGLLARSVRVAGQASHTVAVYCENHKEHTDTLCGENAVPTS